MDTYITTKYETSLKRFGLEDSKDLEQKYQEWEIDSYYNT